MDSIKIDKKPLTRMILWLRMAKQRAQNAFQLGLYAGNVAA